MCKNLFYLNSNIRQAEQTVLYCCVECLSVIQVPTVVCVWEHKLQNMFSRGGGAFNGYNDSWCRAIVTGGELLGLADITQVVYQAHTVCKFTCNRTALDPLSSKFTCNILQQHEFISVKS